MTESHDIYNKTVMPKSKNSLTKKICERNINMMLLFFKAAKVKFKVESI